ncbi:MAG: UvrD-helicase domain-containing protein [Bacteroidales bacterium]|nr:UvrD-helicase domain-containing protein [Bacteroidales bacterium]
MVGSDYLEQLNDAQRAAVEYLDGSELVIAGAGSGKTRVLTYKIVHLLHNGHNPARILALTFTNKAASEMRERISKLVGDDVASRLWMGTFHSIFSRFLRMNAERIGFKSNFTIYDASDSKSLIKSIIRDMKLDDKVYRPTAVASEISNAKNNLYSAEDYARDKDIRHANEAANRPRLAEIYTTYAERCRIAGAMDFDDLLYYTNVLFRDCPDVLEHFREYFTYVLVDEYQDTNFAQHLIVRQLCEKKDNLCVVGDDAQSIYSFRGANIRNILGLKKAFPSLRTFKLEQNYRSTRNIIGAANTLIAANKEQIPKEVFSTNDAGERIEVVQCYNDYEEAYTVASRLNQVRMRMHMAYNDIAILYRTNAQSRVLEEALRNRNVPYRVYGGLAFYQRKEIKDAVCYFRLALNPNDDEAFRRVVNTPKRGIGETTVSKVLAAAIASGVSMYRVVRNPEACGLSVNKSTARKLADFADLLDDFNRRNAKGEDASTLAKYIINKTGLMAEYVTDQTPENISKLENLNELLNGVDNFVENARETNGEDDLGLGAYLAEVSLLTDQDTDAGGDDCVTLMTIHASKGLEFDAIFLVGVEEDLLPSARSSKTESELEEERRLMYVAITRAKRFCMVSYARQRVINGQTTYTFPSRFLKDIDGRFLRLMTGTNIDDAPQRTSTSRPSFYGAQSSGGERRSASGPVKASSLHPTSQPVRVTVTPPSGSAVPAGFEVHASSALSAGMRIEHPRFGIGTIQSIDTTRPDHRIVVTFTDGEERTLLLKFAKFKIL